MRRRRNSLAVFVAVLGAGLEGGFVRRRYVVVTVRGASMVPTLLDGTRVLVARRGPWSRAGQPRAGRIVVVEHPDLDDGSYTGALPDHRDPAGTVWMIKRCTAVAGDPVPVDLPARCATADGRVPGGTLTVRSDEPGHPNDSRRYGFLPSERVLGVVVARLGVPPAMPASSRSGLGVGSRFSDQRRA